MKLILALCLIAFTAWTGEPRQSVKVWSDWMTEGVFLVRAGNYSAAIPAFQHALTIAEASKTGYWELAKTPDSMGGAYAEIGQLAESPRGGILRFLAVSGAHLSHRSGHRGSDTLLICRRSALEPPLAVTL